MFFKRAMMAVALAMAPMTVAADTGTATTELADLRRWTEFTPPGAPFQVDIPMPIKPALVRETSGVKMTTWPTDYGLMSIEIQLTDRPGATTSFSARDNLEMLGGGLIKDWKNPSAKVTDLTVLGYPAAKLEIEHDVSSGRIRVERLLIRVGADDWTVQTTRFVGRDGEVDSAHIFRSIKAVSPAPVLTPAKIGRLTIKAFGKPKITADKLTGDAAATYEKWVTHAFDYKGNTKAWVYNIRVKPGNDFNYQAAAQMIIDDVIQQSNPKPKIYSFPERISGFSGTEASGQAITGDGEEAFRILSVGDGQEGWAILIAGPNDARSATIFREMIESIEVKPQ